MICYQARIFFFFCSVGACILEFCGFPPSPEPHPPPAVRCQFVTGCDRVIKARLHLRTFVLRAVTAWVRKKPPENYRGVRKKWSLLGGVPLTRALCYEQITTCCCGVWHSVTALVRFYGAGFYGVAHPLSALLLRHPCSGVLRWLVVLLRSVHTYARDTTWNAA